MTRWLTDLADIASTCIPSQIQTLASLGDSLSSPFSFVIMGKVKAGKSSFVNALLKSQVCTVDAAPCTDSIQIITYAAQRTESRENPTIRHIGLPVDILKTIAIVDTPGTDTVIEAHQEIAERFIPNSDVVFFVFMAKNPYSKTDWELVRKIRNTWKRHVVFILQQIDTVSRDDLKQHRAYIEKLAFQCGISPCTVFEVSARREDDGAADSGFREVRQYIVSTITGGKHYGEKLLNIAVTGRVVMADIEKALENEKARFDWNRQFMAGLKSRLLLSRKHSLEEGKALAERLIECYDAVGNIVKKDFAEGLATVAVLQRSFAGIFNRRNGLQKWREDTLHHFRERLKTDISREIAGGVPFIQDGMKLSLQGVRDEFQKWRTLHTSQSYDAAIEERISGAISRIEQQLDDLLSESHPELDAMQTDDEISKGIQLGGGLGAAGVMLALLAHTMWIDITGGALTAVGALVAIFTLSVRRKDAIAILNRAIDSGRAKYDPDVTGKIQHIIHTVFDHVDRIIQPLDDIFKEEGQRILPATARLSELASACQELCNDIEAEGRRIEGPIEFSSPPI